MIMPTIRNSLEERILEELNKNPISVSKLANLLGLRREFLTGFLEAMRMDGKVNVIDVGRAKVYIPVGGKK